jgi:hypothetical protein
MLADMLKTEAKPTHTLTITPAAVAATAVTTSTTAFALERFKHIASQRAKAKLQRPYCYILLTAATVYCITPVFQNIMHCSTSRTAAI